MSSANSTPATTGLVGWLAANRGRGGVLLAVLGAAVLAVPVLLGAYYQWEFASVIVCTAMLGFLFLCVGVMLKFLPAEEGDSDRVRMLVLLLGGGGGLLIAAAGVCLTYQWWSFLTAWLRDDEREGIWRILVALITLLTGLAIMFAALQTARAEERTNPALRRLVFGYNAVLGGVLLLILLAVVNAYVSARYTNAIESVDRGDTTLSERAINVAKGLDRSVQFYVIWPTEDDYIYPLRALLNNLEDTSKQVRVEYLSPTLDASAVADLARKYPGKLKEGRGVLVVKGDDKPDTAIFLKAPRPEIGDLGDLYSQEGFGESAQIKFKGEDRIIASLMTDKAIVYVTQGGGEADLNDANPRTLDRGFGVLRERLGARGNLDVRPLRLSPADPTVPADAAVVVVANPQPPVGAALMKALRSYLVERKGKAIFLIDVPPRDSGVKVMPATGLEGLLGEFGVEVTNERIYSAEALQMPNGQVLEERDFVILQLAAEFEQSGNELAKQFQRKSLLTRGVRVIRSGRMAANPMLRAEPLLTTRPGMTVWTETDMTVDPERTLAEMEKNPAARKRVSPTPLPAAVVVSESSPPSQAPGGPPPTSKPRVVVFGDATFISNGLVGEASVSPANFAFFASTLDWLSERPTSLGVGAKSLKYYSLDQTTSGISLVVLPGVIALVGIVGLGLAVWTVRRR